MVKLMFNTNNGRVPTSRPDGAAGIQDICSSIYITSHYIRSIIVQELCESRGGRPGLSVLTSLLVSVDVKNY